MNKANWDTANYAIKQESENFKEETWGGGYYRLKW